jgi:hypothetical protein
MDFPNTKITLSVRRGILVFFIATFFIITPIITMYTKGYRYDWENKKLISVGAINIDLEPKNATVYIDDILQKSGIPLRLKDKMPGKYNIRITADGYFDWQKNIDIKNQQTVYIKDIAMIKKNEPQILVTGKIENATLSKTKNFLAYVVKNGDKKQVWIRNMKDGVASVAVEYTTTDAINITFATKNNWLAVSNEMSPYNILNLINAENFNNKIDLMEKIKYPIIKYEWNEDAEPELFFSTALKIMSIYPLDEQMITLGENKYEDWYMETGKLWTIEKNTSTQNIRIMEDALGNNKIFIEENQLKKNEQEVELLAVKDQHILLKKRDEDKMIFLNQEQRYDFAGQKFLISDYNEWWIFWTPWEIRTCVLGEEPILLSRTGQQLQEVLPMDKYNTLMLNWAEKTTVLFPYYLVSHDFNNNKITSPMINTENRIIYFIADISGQKGIWEVEY